MKMRLMTVVAAGCLMAALPVAAQFSGGQGTQADPYLVGSAAALNVVSNHLGSLTNTVFFRQIADIDLSGYSPWQPIGTLSSNAYVHYDGNHRIISNLSVSGTADYVGLFGYLSGSVVGLSLESGSVSGGSYVGSIVGFLNNGVISNCTSRASVSGTSAVGGLVGWSQGGKVYHSGYRSGTVTGSTATGGLVGYNAGRVQGSFSAGAVVSSSGGGLAGHAGTGSVVVDSYWDTQVSGKSTSAGGGTGLSTAAMMQRASFIGWNFSSRWQLYEGKSYPYLRAQAQAVAAPVFDPGGGEFPGSSVAVTVTCATAGATIHYTRERTEPTDLTTNTVVSGGVVEVELPGTLQAVAWVPYMNPSAVTSAEYEPAPPVNAPTANPAGGSYAGAQVVVTLSTTTSNAVIRYTLDDSEPDEASAEVPPSGEVTVPIPSTLKAKAWRSDLNPSQTLTAIYSSAAAVATPTFSPDGGAHAGTHVMVTVSSTTSGATIRYTTDGSEPTELSAGVASGGTVSVPVPGTLKAKAWADGLNPSAVKSADYTVAAAVETPTFSPDGGAHPGGSVQVVISSATEGATIRYTTDGSVPTELSAGVASGGTVSVPVPGTLKARGWKAGLNPSAIKQADYSSAGAVATPSFSPDGGPVAAATVSVIVSNATSGATIRYTTDGSEPTETSAAVSSGGTVSVPVPGTLRAKAWADGLNPSAVKTADYTTATPAAKPTFNPGGGAYAGSSVSVTMESATAGATIHYTTDGTAPTEESPSVASGGTVSVPMPGTLRARAYRTGFFPSAEQTAYYGDFAGGTGTAQDPYRIATAVHLDKVRNHLSAHFVMIADIDLGVSPWNSGAGWAPIGAGYNGNYHVSGLSGTFDGQGYIISNLFINRPDLNEAALFGYVQQSGAIRGLGVVSQGVTGKRDTGLLVGYNEGSVSNCYAIGGVVGETYVGGLAGRALSTSQIVNSFAQADITYRFATDVVGGLVGWGSSGGNIVHSYAAGTITASGGTGTRIGGLVGDGTVTVVNSYWNTQTSGLSVSSGGTGRTTVQMRQQATFAGWNFDSVWMINEGVDYPRLRLFHRLGGEIPDSWLIAYYGSVEAAPEFSVKGVLLWYEYVAGTDPTDMASRFVVNGTDLAGGTLVLTYSSVTGRVYRILERENLSAGGWDLVDGILPQSGTGGELQFEIEDPKDGWFYRLSVERSE